MNAAKEMEDAQADRANDTMENLWFHLREFLTFLLLDVWTVPAFRHATEQAQLACDAECKDIVYEKTRHQGRDFYGKRELLLHKRLWDIVTRDRAGRAKEQSFSEWCRRVAMHSGTTNCQRGR